MSLDEANKTKFIINALSFLSVFQFYLIHLGSIYIQVYVLFAYYILFKAFRLNHNKTVIEKCAVALFIFQIISFWWAKSIFTGMREIFFTLPFLISLFYSIDLATKQERQFKEAVIFYAKCSSVNALLIIVGRLIPSLKFKFLSSFIASLFINGNALYDPNVYITGSNILDSAKSGGFLINANVAGAWMLLAYHLVIALYFATKNKSLIYIALIHLIAVLLCGSKISLLCIPISLCFSFVFVNIFWIKDKLRKTASLFASLALMIAIISAFWIFNLDEKIPYTLIAPFEARMVTWTFGWLEFLKNPLWGHGYGGWTEVFATSGFVRLDLGLTEFSASQNTFITLWSQSGLIAVLIGVTFLVSCFVALIKTNTNKYVVMMLSAGLFAFFLQGQGENYGLFGDVHTMHLLALFLGYITLLSTNKVTKNSTQAS